MKKLLAVVMASIIYMTSFSQTLTDYSTEWHSGRFGININGFDTLSPTDVITFTLSDGFGTYDPSTYVFVDTVNFTGSLPSGYVLDVWNMNYSNCAPIIKAFVNGVLVDTHNIPSAGCGVPVLSRGGTAWVGDTFTYHITSIPNDVNFSLVVPTGFKILGDSSNHIYTGSDYGYADSTQAYFASSSPSQVQDFDIKIVNVAHDNCLANLSVTFLCGGSGGNSLISNRTIQEVSFNCGKDITGSPLATPSTGCNVSGLPVKLINFTAKKDFDNNVSLSWQTTSEENNTGWAIEASTDAKTWTKVGFVKSKNTNSETLTNYSFLYNPSIKYAGVGCVGVIFLILVLISLIKNKKAFVPTLAIICFSIMTFASCKKNNDSPVQIGYKYFRLHQIDVDGKNIYSDVKTVN